MAITATTHLNFTGTARSALEFYRSVFGGELRIATYAEFGMPAEIPGADTVVFGLLAGNDGFRLMAYDVPAHGATELAATQPSTRRENNTTLTNQPFFVAISGSSLEEIQPVWDRLADGAEIVEPLAPSAFSPGFGMLTDSYGVTWSVDVTPPQHG